MGDNAIRYFCGSVLSSIPSYFQCAGCAMYDAGVHRDRDISV